MIGPIKPSEIKELAPLPASVVRLAKIVSDPGSALGEIRTVIEYDHSLTANVLRWANSAWSQSRTPIDSVAPAIVRLGAKNILKMAMAYHLKGPLSQSSAGYDLAENELWHHSLAAALTIEQMKRFTRKPIPSGAFAAALMHDIGKLILGRHLGMEGMKEKIRAQMESQGGTYVESERKVMGTDHAEVGAAIVAEWKLPEAMAVVIASHHAPDAASDSLLDAVHIGNVVAKLIGRGMGSEQMHLHVSSQAAERFDLDETRIQALCAVVNDQLEETLRSWDAA